MGKTTYFDTYWGEGWPSPDWLKGFFVAPKEQQWSYRDGNESWRISIEGAEGTEQFEPTDPRRINIHLLMWGNSDLGVMLIYSKRGGGYKDIYNSKGDTLRLREHVRSLQDTPLPVGLFIPFDKAWPAVKEFMDTEGKLPKSIEWIPNEKLPPGTFSEP